jgi:Flp pilus assembly pilin Flp
VSSFKVDPQKHEQPSVTRKQLSINNNHTDNKLKEMISMDAFFTYLRAWYDGRLRPKLRQDGGATTLEYVIIAAIVCAAAVILTTVIVNAINNYSSQIPTG